MEIVVSGEHKIVVLVFSDMGNPLKYFIRIDKWIFDFEEIISMLSLLGKDIHDCYLENHSFNGKSVKVHWNWHSIIPNSSGKSLMMGSQCLREKAIISLLDYILEQDLVNSKRKALEALRDFCKGKKKD